MTEQIAGSKRWRADERAHEHGYCSDEQSHKKCRFASKPPALSFHDDTNTDDSFSSPMPDKVNSGPKNVASIIARATPVQKMQALQSLAENGAFEDVLRDILSPKC